MSGPGFESEYTLGPRRVPPEGLLKSLFLISLYSIGSKRSFCRELDYNLPHRWFLDVDLTEPSFDATVFTKSGEGRRGARREGLCSRRWRARRTGGD